MKSLGVLLWARTSSIEACLRECLSVHPRLQFLWSRSGSVCSDSESAYPPPQPIRVIPLARNPMVEAYLRQELNALPNLSLTFIGKQESQPDAVVIDGKLLTPSERRVLQACAEYDRLAEAAGALCLTEATIKKHLCHIYTKLGRHSLHRALLCATEWGLIVAPQ